MAAFARVALVGRDAYLADVATLPAHRRRGDAGALVRGALVDARAVGAERGLLSATAVAHPLYRALSVADVAPLVGCSVG